MVRTGQECERACETIEASHAVVETLYTGLNTRIIKAPSNAPLFERPGTQYEMN